MPIVRRPKHNMRFREGVVWSFSTKRLCVELVLEKTPFPDFDLDLGEDDVVFDAEVRIKLFDFNGDSWIIAVDTLGQCIYNRFTAGEFWTSHRDPDPLNRNCTLMRRERGQTLVIGHYFPDMVREVVRMARESLPIVKRQLTPVYPPGTLVYPKGGPV